MKYLHVRSHILWIVLATLAMGGAMFNSFYIGRSLTERHAPLMAAVLEVTHDVTVAHLWYEKVINGDRSLSVEGILRNLDQVVQDFHAMLDGGETREASFSPLEDADLRRKLEKALKDITIFRKIAADRWLNRGQFGIRSQAEQGFDVAFNNFLVSAADIEKTLQDKINEQLGKFDILQVFLVVATLVLGAFAGLVLRQNRKALINSEKNTGTCLIIQFPRSS